MEDLKKIYIDRLPLHGFATDNLEYGIRMYPVELAIKKAIIQHNFKHSIGWLVYDIDRSTAIFDWNDYDAPPPNIIVINKDNGHGHYFYGLEKPVHNYEKASKKALRYFGAIDVALTEKLEADPGYSKLLSKNPIHNRWLTIYQKNDLYTLEELADWLQLKKYQDRRRKLPGTGYGRNVTLFEMLRVWSYRERRQPYLSEELFYTSVLAHAHALNATENNPPLSHAEVRSVAKSVSRWTWRNLSQEGFRAAQRRLSIKAGIKRHEKALMLRKRIVEAVEQCPGLTQEDIAAMMGVSRETVNRHIRASRGVTAPISDNRLSPGDKGDVL